jgi:hypothetical protein
VLLTGAVLLGAGPMSTVSDETVSVPLALAAARSSPPWPTP